MDTIMDIMVLMRMNMAHIHIIIMDISTRIIITEVERRENH